MKFLSMPNLVAGLCMLAAAGLSIAMKPTIKTADKGSKVNLEAMIPAKFGNWVIDPNVVQVKPSPDVQKNLDQIYNQILTRTYVNGKGDRIMLSIAYGSNQTGEFKAHRQEVCYAAQGFQIMQLIHQTINIGSSAIPVTRMFAVQQNRNEPVTYWFTVGDRVVLSAFDRTIVQLKYGLTGEIPDGMLVRVSNLSSNPDTAYQTHIAFVRDLIAHLKKQDIKRLIGYSPG